MLEYIVRPFASPNAHNTTIISSNPHESTETAILTWGGESTLPSTQFIDAGFKYTSCKEDHTELRRDTETVRITGEDPGDGPSYIDVSRATKLYLKKESNKTGQNPGTAGQTDYAADIGGFSPSEAFRGKGINDVEKCAVTMNLKNNTTAAGG